MNRVYATALTLVNWKGVFYERYLLDRHVTALEGDNGAGKTTVMIAAYVVLLPDMARLRFTNLGETGATGGDKGIWGRLGESGRPSYATLTFRVAGGRRVLAGVHLTRKGEPTVEPTPFIITDLAADVRHQDLLLLHRGDLDQIPELAELRENVARLGAQMKVFSTAKEYFSALFDHGIGAMRLSTDEERSKLNEMLKTSMTGGMSRGLLSELRSFLLKGQGDLAETLQRMRDNLNACRRTRVEVEETRTQEREIREIFTAGQDMFACAVAATEHAAEESANVARRTEEARAELGAQAREARAKHNEAQRQVEAAGREVERLRQVHEVAVAWRDRARLALHWSREVARREAADLEAREREAAAVLAAEAAEQAHAVALRELDEANDQLQQAAHGLADLQSGLDDLHYRAAEYREVVRQRDIAREALADEVDGPLDPVGQLTATRSTLDEAHARHLAVDEARRELQQRFTDDADHQRRFDLARQALETIQAVDDAPRVATAPPFDQGSDALERVSEWRHLAADRTTHARRARQLSEDQARRTKVEDAARALELRWDAGHAKRDITAVLQAREEAHEQRRDELAAAEQRARELAAEHLRLVAEREALEARTVRYDALAARIARIGTTDDGRQAAPWSGAGVHPDRGALRATRDRLRATQATLRQSVEAQREAVDALRREAHELRAAGGTFPDALLRTRDELAAELLASHFEEVGVEEAAVLEARLGPLAQALVVSDVKVAAELVDDRPDALASMWFVAEDADLSPILDGDETGGRDVLVEESVGWRVTRVPAAPRLGRAAREAQAQALSARADRLHDALDQARERLTRVDQHVDDLEHVMEALDVWLAGDPREALAACDHSLEAARAERREVIARRDTAAVAAKKLLLRVREVRALLPDVGLLDDLALDERLEAAQALAAQAEAAARALRVVGDAPAVLREHHAALRHRPWTDDERERAQHELQALKADEDRLRRGAEALAYTIAHHVALQWADAPRTLTEQTALRPALEQRLQSAEAEVTAARGRERDARDRQELAARARLERRSELGAAETALAEARSQLEAQAVADVDEPLVEQAEAEVVRCDAELRRVQAAAPKLDRALGEREAELRAVNAQLASAEAAAEDARRKAEPFVAAWRRLQEVAAEDGLLRSVRTDAYVERFAGKGSVNLWSEADLFSRRLRDHVMAATGANALVEALNFELQETPQAAGERYLGNWRQVRQWLVARLPAVIAEVDDPLVGLTRFGQHLERLTTRLDEQERALRGASTDIARGIGVQIRKSRSQVTRLNKHLEGVRFGSVRRIRVRIERIERMEKLLRALRDDAVQELLFEATMPLEDALDEVFKRYAGGRTSGQRLLDYREYVHLSVEVMRHDTQTWEVANPTRLSTGEAIGVGAALMMVVLTEWERDATVLRGRRAVGSLRFLFLDEANRLDAANLGTIFELCRNLDLQLLVAAPEVAQAQGATVFRLVRTRTADGRDEVLVTGRRVVIEHDDASPEADPAPQQTDDETDPTQGSLV